MFYLTEVRDAISQESSDAKNKKEIYYVASCYAYEQHPLSRIAAKVMITDLINYMCQQLLLMRTIKLAMAGT